MQISNLPASNSFSSTDVLPIEINGVTYKVTGATLAAALQTLGGYALADKLDATQSDIAIIIDGNQTTHTGGVAVGEYVIVRNSTISGIADGLYKVVQAIPANTAITSAYLEAVDGGLGSEVASLNSKIEDKYWQTGVLPSSSNYTDSGVTRAQLEQYKFVTLCLVVSNNDDRNITSACYPVGYVLTGAIVEAPFTTDGSLACSMFYSPTTGTIQYNTGTGGWKCRIILSR